MIPKKSGQPRVQLGRDSTVNRYQPVDRGTAAIEALASAAPAAGSDFFTQCTQLLAQAFDAAFAYIAVLADEPSARLSTLAFQHLGQPAVGVTYDPREEPCADVLAHDQVFIASGATAAYPNSRWLSDLGVDGYLGMALVSPSQQRLGVVVVADNRPVVRDPAMQRVLTVFAERIAGEIVRQRELEQLEMVASVFNYAPLGVMITDRGHRIRRVNRSFSTITGWQESEAIGRREAMLSAGRDAPDMADQIQAALDRDGMWLGELWSRRRDGEVYPENRTVVAVQDEAGRLHHYVSLFSDISAEKFAAERIHRLAHYDATTELPNRVLLQDRLLHAINRATRSGGRLALLFLDLDGFKLINDTYGHSAGDEVLRMVGERLMSRLRKADIVARLGGDEFAVVLTDVNHDNDVQGICEQLLQVITEPHELSGHDYRVTTSIGIAMFPQDGSDVPTLLKHADAAMYQAKENGKNRYAFYQPEMNKRAEERLQLTRQLHRAFDGKEFSLCYQPQYDLASGRLVGVEALVRWQDEDGRTVPPTRFIPLAEDSGLIVPLGAWILQEACRHAQQWRAQGLDFGRLSVNISGRQFQDEGLPGTVTRALQASGLPGELLELEITETWVMEGPYHADKQMRELNEMGVSLVIDDFGVANSSMAYLKRFPVHKLKIDRSFVRDIPADADDVAIVSAIIAMGHSLGLRVLAEGVETAEQSAFLRGTGCDEVQGFLFGHPVPHDEMNVLLLYNPSLSSS